MLRHGLRCYQASGRLFQPLSPVTQPILINARAAARPELGGVERWAREMVKRLPVLRPDVYRVAAPRARLVHRAGHLWEQTILPLQARRERAAAIFNPANLAPLATRRNVVVIHDASALLESDWYSPAYLAAQRTLLPAVARRALHVVTVSEFSRRELLEHLSLAEGDISVVPGGVGKEFTPNAADEDVLLRYGLAKPYVLAVGSRTARKNLSVLERDLVSKLFDRGVTTVTVGGARPQFRQGEVASGEILDLERVPESDLPALYAGAEVLVMPSLYEGFGLPCIEAMASGVPVVASNASALPETCGDAALYANPLDPCEFTAQVMSLLDSDDSRNQLIERGLARAARFSWAASAEKVDAVLTAHTA